MFKGFNLDRFKNMKPPSDASFTTAQEIKQLSKIPLNKDSVKRFDNIEKTFANIAAKNNITNYDPKLVSDLIKKSAPVIIKLKKHFNRPRPKVLARKMGIDMQDYEMESMKTSSYPSGHSTQGVLIGMVLADKYPKAAKQFKQAGKNISDSRNIARAHYKSDSNMGKKLGAAMYEHIKNKV
jgi:ribosomal protein RSM22 (predicted rRNA methylase)